MNTCNNKMEERKEEGQDREKEGHTFILAWLEIFRVLLV